MLLMEEAERIALEEHGSSKIAVISGRIFSSKFIVFIMIVTDYLFFIQFVCNSWSTELLCPWTTWSRILFWCLLLGVGTRNYYRKIGYELEGPYMTKSLEKLDLWQIIFEHILTFEQKLMMEIDRSCAVWNFIKIAKPLTSA